MNINLLHLFMESDLVFEMGNFCVGAVCQFCGCDIDKTQMRAIVSGGRMHYHVCTKCIGTTKELSTAIEVEIRKLKMKKALDKFKKRLEEYGR
jgi:hypothetical protein